MDCLERRDILIEEVRKRPYLYTPSLKGYKDVKLKENAWREISDITKIPDSEKVFKNLRDVYCKKVKALEKNIAEGGTGYEKWPFMKSLEFLRDHLRRRRNFSAFQPIPMNESHQSTSIMMLEENNSLDVVDVSINPEYSAQVISEMPATTDRNLDFCNSVPNCDRLNDTLSSSVSTSDACSPVNHASKATSRKRKSVEYKSELLKIVKASCRWLEEFSDDRDDCFYFGMQITTRLRKLPANVRAKVQVDILSLINEYEFAS